MLVNLFMSKPRNLTDALLRAKFSTNQPHNESFDVSQKRQDRPRHTAANCRLTDSNTLQNHSIHFYRLTDICNNIDTLTLAYYYLYIYTPIMKQ